MDVEIRVPATIANLGPGFDCLGVAIATYLEMSISPAKTTQITGKGRIRSVPDSLTYRAFTSAFAECDREAPEIRIDLTEIYPSARGMGASASAIVAGLVGARAVGDLPLTDADLGRLAIRIEGHSDNVLPALFGGIVLSSHEGWLHVLPSNELSPIVCIARDKFQTEAARRVLPTEVPRVDAVANAAATAGLVAVLSGVAPPASLMSAMEDRIHEPYRLPLMPETLDLHASLRDKGIPTALAGAGPSLVSIVPKERTEEAEEIARSLAPDGWTVISPGWDVEGAQFR